MRTVDLLRLAVKSLRTKGIALPLMGFASGAFCLCYAGAVAVTVQAEKAEPFELNVSVQGSAVISDGTIAKLAALPSVAAATPILNVPATVKTGNYTATLTLTGIDGSYLGVLWQGGLFPESSAMPYIVLNKSACRQFSNGSSSDDSMAESSDDAADGQDTAQATLPSIEWLSASFSIQTSGPRAVVSKVCGILFADDAEQRPAACISLSTAKALLRDAGQTPAVMVALVRVQNIGAANSVSQAIQALGLTAADTNSERQAKWDTEIEEAGFLLATGLFALLAVAVVQVVQRRCLLLEQRQAWEMLRWLGMGPRAVRWLFVLQAGLLSLFGAVVGIIIAAVLPSFLPQELAGKSIFLLSVPWVITVVDAALCIIIGTLPTAFIRSAKVL